MISFLRKIRKSLFLPLSEGKTLSNFNKYILYGIGEIVLVVIGILIALQINNWNGSKKDQALEIKILTEIRANLIDDFTDHEENSTYLAHVVASSQIILDHLNNNLPYHDSLAEHFAWMPMAANFDPINSGYELWLSEGVRIITSDSIRLGISRIYVQKYTWLRDFLKDRQYLNNQPLFLDMMKKFKVFEHLNRAVPRDYEGLKRDDDFKVLVQQNAFTINSTLGFYLQIMEDCQQMIENLQFEIDRLKNNE